jgi:heterodisulfide reductase subunit C
MKNWGYSIHKDNQIDLDRNDTSLYKALKIAEPSIVRCISCGSCGATCSSGEYTSLSFRKIMIQVSRGETKDLYSNLSQCMLCGKCILVCPRDVNTRNAIKKLLHLLTTKN